MNLRTSIAFQAWVGVTAFSIEAAIGSFGPLAHAQGTETRQSVMDAACASGGDACRQRAAEALAKDRPVQRIILQACLAEFSRTGEDAAKERATACLAAALNATPHMSSAELQAGQPHAASPAKVSPQSATLHAESALRTGLSAAGNDCAGIGNLYSRYNCYVQKLHDMNKAPR